MMKVMYITEEMHTEIKKWAGEEGRTLKGMLEVMMSNHRSARPAEGVLGGGIDFDFYPYELLKIKGLKQTEIDKHNREYNDCFSLLSPEQSWQLVKKKIEITKGYKVDEDLKFIKGGELSMGERMKMRDQILKFWVGLLPEKFKETTIDGKIQDGS